MHTAKKTESGVKDEVKTREQISKQLKDKEKNKIKQMNKKDRAAYLKRSGGQKGNSGFAGKRRK